MLGLQSANTILEGVRASLPRGSPQGPALDQVIHFATLAINNLDLSNQVLSSVSSPLAVRTTTIGAGGKQPLDTFAVAVAVTISMMFVCVLLAAGMLALEREENAFTRLARGLVSRFGLVTEKISLAALCATVVALAMLIGIGIFVAVDWGRFPLWVVATLFGAAGFGALGVAIGGWAREVRAASLFAFLLSLPIAVLALVPSGRYQPDALRHHPRDLGHLPLPPRAGRDGGGAVGRRDRAAAAAPGHPRWFGVWGACPPQPQRAMCA